MPYQVNKKGIIGLVASIINLGIGIAALVYAIRIFIYSSENPFENKIIDSPEKYFNDMRNLFMDENPKCKCGQEIFESRCSEEQKTLGCWEVLADEQSLENKKTLRYLMETSKCEEYEKLIKGGKPLNEIFELKISTIHIISLIMMIIVILFFIFFLILLFTTCGCICFACFVKDPDQFIYCLPWFIIIVVILGICNAISFIILCVFYYTGDMTTYAGFLDCSNVNKNQFIQDFQILEDLRSAFTTFLVLNIIGIILGFLSTCTSKK